MQAAKALPTSTKKRGYLGPRQRADPSPREKRNRSIVIRMATSSGPCLIPAMRVKRSVLKSASGAVSGDVRVALENGSCCLGYKRSEGSNSNSLKPAAQSRRLGVMFRLVRQVTYMGQTRKRKYQKKTGLVATQTKQQLERGRHTNNTAKAKGRQAEHTRETRASLLQKGSEKKQRARAKLSRRRSTKHPKKGKDGGLIARVAIRTGSSLTNNKYLWNATNPHLANQDALFAPNQFSPTLTLKIPDWRTWAHTDGSCHIQNGKQETGAGVYCPPGLSLKARIMLRPLVLELPAPYVDLN
eukprot:1141983-Pelagomonas_calceolata.AAC.1